MTTMVTAESFVDLPPSEAYGLFGTPGTGGWLFDAQCQSLSVGAAISMRLPLGDGAGRPGVDLLGRVTAVRPSSSIVVEHAQPWLGRLTLQFDPAGPRRTRLRVRADVPPAGVDWLVRRTGVSLPVPAVAPGAVRIGLVTSKSGPGAIYSVATEYLAEMAADEVNASGGLDGRRLELLVADDATDPATAAVEARRLVGSGCRAIFACTTSSSFTAMRRVVRPSEALLVHAVINERGGGGGASVVRLGESPSAQIRALARRVMRETGTRDWFLVGEGYSWSYGAHLSARRALPRARGRVVGEACTPLGTGDYAAVLDDIRRSGADIVLSSLVGSDEVAFQRQCADAGLTSSVQRVSLVMDESTCEHIGPWADDIWTALGYFQDGPTDGNAGLRARYRSAYGRWAPPLSALSETVYEAVLQYARALRHDVDDSPVAQRRALTEDMTRVRSLEIGRRHLLSPPLYLARVIGGAPQVLDLAG